MGGGTSVVRPAAGRGQGRELVVSAALLGLAALGWWWSIRTAEDMGDMEGAMGSATSMSFAAFVTAWVAMMTAMMFPSVSPMVRVYARASARGAIAPVPYFVVGYLLVWTLVGIPGFVAWRSLQEPLEAGEAWTGRLAGSILLAAAAYQLSPLKDRCLRHCRSPISFFLHHAGNTTDTPARAIRLGAHHGAFCLGCCGALMAVLVALGTMHLGWMAVLAVVIFLEKLAPDRLPVPRLVAGLLGVGAAVLLLDPSAISTIT